MAKSHTISRGASAGLAVTLLALTAISFLGVTSTRGSAEAVSNSSALAGAYVRAQQAVAAEESLKRKYRLEPTAEVRIEFASAGAQLRAALADVQGWGRGEDRDLAIRVSALHASYNLSIDRLFSAVDAGDRALALDIDASEVDPAFDKMNTEVQAAAEAHNRAAERAVAALGRVETFAFIATFAGLAVGLGLLAAFGAMAVGYRRELLRQSRLNQHQALHDALTGLPNRTLFTDRVGQALAASRRYGRGVSVMVLDVDRFKEVNDTLGHNYGDELLRQVATRVRGVLRASDTVARLAGDEFAMLLPATDTADVTELARRVLHVLHQSFQLDDMTVDVEASIGVVLAPEHGDTVEDLMRFADVAMYAAKNTKTGIVIHDPSTQVHGPARLTLLGDLRRAMEQPAELVLHYQPKVDLQLGELCGVEALLRWYHPARGLIPPSDFIPVAEGTGLINRLTTHVLAMAISQTRSWLDQGVQVPVAVNLSARCLLDTTLPLRVKDMLEEHRVPASLLRLEVTETAIMANTELALAILTELHEFGVRLSVDDYGTGYSSMAYLKRLPVDELKIDRSFVLDMTTDDNDLMLVRGAIDLGHNLGLTVVAEGVELAGHVAALNRLGCDIAQGYHYARPMAPERLTEWMREGDVRIAHAAAVAPQPAG